MKSLKAWVLVSVLCVGCDGAVQVPDAATDARRDGDTSSPCAGKDDGTACGTGMVCMDEACVTAGGPSCGDGVVDAGEECDDGNAVAFDGCEPETCQLTCHGDADCGDGIECNGAEICAPCADEACTAGRRCMPGDVLADGTPCDDAMGLCRSEVCAPPDCGDGVVDADEHCDDGNTTPNDGCELDCRFTCEVDSEMTNTWYLDCDGDGYAATEPDPRTQCLQPPAEGCGGGWTLRNPVVGAIDCDDTDPEVRPGAAELCDGIDNNCVGGTDDSCTAIPCTTGDECASGFCADGVCCDSACDGQCEACNLAGTAGTCSQVTGDPVGSRPACDGEGICGGSCGSSRAVCDYPTVMCRAQSCSDATVTHSAMCDGAGACPAEATDSCAPYACSGTSCRTNCAADADCSAGSYCNAGLCLGTKPRGYTCGANAECTTGYCVDGFCCDTACNGQCEQCSATPGTCGPRSGAPIGDRPACNSDPDTSACTGTCDGINRASCVYPTRACEYCDSYCGGGGICINPDSMVATGTCSAGECVVSSRTSCGAYECKISRVIINPGPYCPVSCDTAADCDSGLFVTYRCVDHRCVTP